MVGITALALVTLQGAAIAYKPYRLHRQTAVAAVAAAAARSNASDNSSSNGNYQDQHSVHILELFRAHITSRQRGEGSPPVVLLGGGSSTGITFIFIRRKDVYAVAIAEGECNPVLALQTLANAFDVFALCLGDEFGEKELRNNFTLVYELLDELVDYGLPQASPADVLSAQAYSSPSASYSPRILSLSPLKRMSSPKRSSTLQLPPVKTLVQQLTGQLDWRRAGIHYKQNAFYVDVVETLNCLIGKEGEIVRSDVVGEMRVNSCLSGMPECKLVLNDFILGAAKLFGDDEADDSSKTAASSLTTTTSSNGHYQPESSQDNADTAAAGSAISIDDISFHRCVRMSKLDADKKSIVFTPPDGQFELLKYRVSDQCNLPFRVLVLVDQPNSNNSGSDSGARRISYNVRVQATFPLQVTCQAFSLRVPVPPNATKVTITPPTVGTARFDPAENVVVWRARTMSGGGEEYVLRASAELAVDQAQHKKHAAAAVTWARPPLLLSFKLMPYTSSGLYVCNAKIIESSGYSTRKFVRYVTRAGNYEIRF